MKKSFVETFFFGGGRRSSPSQQAHSPSSIQMSLSSSSSSSDNSGSVGRILFSSRSYDDDTLRNKKNDNCSTDDSNTTIDEKNTMNHTKKHSSPTCVNTQHRSFLLKASKGGSGGKLQHQQRRFFLTTKKRIEVGGGGQWICLFILCLIITVGNGMIQMLFSSSSYSDSNGKNMNEDSSAFNSTSSVPVTSTPTGSRTYLKKKLDRTTFVVGSHDDHPSTTNSAAEIKSGNEMATATTDEGPIVDDEEQRLLNEVRDFVVTPLEYPLDYEQYTIRMNTWKRNDLLIASLDHHVKCPGVAQIQVVWCDSSTPPPPQVINHSSNKVVVEYHQVNSLNERFHILSEPPTKGILSLDDDVIRSCEALDAAFFKWTKAPSQLVGFDDRLHGRQRDFHLNKEASSDEEGWNYLGLAATKKANQYSMVLLRSAFLHRDYLDLYMTHVPASIHDYVTANKNCEDIAMSLFISFATQGKPPLLADGWATNSMMKLYSPQAISTGDKQHKLKRHMCVTQFAKRLGLYEGDANELPSFRRKHDTSIFEYGAPLEHDVETPPMVEREVQLNHAVSHFTDPQLSSWKFNIEGASSLLEKGLIANTATFESFHQTKKQQSRKSLSKEELWMALGYHHNALTPSQLQVYLQLKEILKERPWMKSMCHEMTQKSKPSPRDDFLNATYCDGI